MVKYYKTDDRQIHEEEKIQNGVWIQMVNPSVAEGQMIADALNVDIEDVLAALDEEESSRIELQDGYTLILVDIPSIEIRHDKESYTTIPLGIILTADEIITICTEDTPVLQAFLNNRVKEFSTKKKLRFVYQILYRVSVLYQSDLRIIDKMRTEIEERVGDDTEEEDLVSYMNWSQHSYTLPYRSEQMAMCWTDLRDIRDLNSILRTRSFLEMSLSRINRLSR